MVEYGEQAKEVIARHTPAVGLGLAALVIIFFVVRSFLRKKEGARGQESEAGGRGPEAGSDSDAKTWSQDEAEGSTDL